MINTFTEEKLVKILAVLLALTVCTTRISMAAGQVFQGLALLTGIVLFFRQGRRLTLNSESKRYYTVALAFFATTAVSVVGAVNPGTVIKEFFNVWIWRSVIFVLIAAFIHRRDYLVNMLAAFLVVLGLDCFTAAGEAIVLKGRGWGFGLTVGNPLALCGMMCLVFPAACVILSDTRFEQKLKKAAAFCTAGILGGQLGAQSRAAWLVALVSAPLVILPYIKKSLKYLTVVISVIAVVVGVFFARPKYVQRLLSSTDVTENWSNTHRLWLWKSCINMFKDHPVNGIGLGNFQMYYKDHGYYLHDGKMEPGAQGPETLKQKQKANKKKVVKTPVVTNKPSAANKPAVIKKPTTANKVADTKKPAAEQKKTAQQNGSSAKGIAKQSGGKKQAVAKKPVVRKNNKKAAATPQKPKRFAAAGHAHNSYFQLLAETGVIGFIGLLGFVLYSLTNSLRGWLRQRNPYDLIVFTSFLSFFVLFAQVEHIVDNSSAVRMMWFLLAVVLQMKALEKNSE